MSRFKSAGGGIHHSALIGQMPEHRDWHVDDPCYEPRLGHGVRIEALCTVDCGMLQPTRIGDHTWLMKGVHVGHDTLIGEDCELAPHVVICGECVIGDNVKIGAGALLRPRVRIGAGARIGIGAVVVKDVPAGEVWVGNPAQCLYDASSNRPMDPAAFEHLHAA